MLDTLGALLHGLEAWTLALAGSPWVYVVVGVLCLVDGFFPPLPSESVVIALAVTAWTGGDPGLAALGAAAAVGAWSGDQVAYRVGGVVGTERFRVLRSAAGRRAVDLARRGLARRGATLVVAARYVPVGRVAVNMSAGAVGYPRRRFLLFSGVAAVAWSGCALAIGVLSAAWLGDRPLVAVAAGVVVGLLLGLVVDRVAGRTAGPRGQRDAGHAPRVPVGDRLAG
ncbi:DedA family protein [Luteimicrobium subarcticum]|uniref:DedA family protein n=1 Tax=Luteimicrobium subarcticum TaxID=620910 RepID=UPI001474245D|nr:VTT domain-containing protein [Luteimicrobium subarcticum]